MKKFQRQLMKIRWYQEGENPIVCSSHTDTLMIEGDANGNVYLQCPKCEYRLSSLGIIYQAWHEQITMVE